MCKKQLEDDTIFREFIKHPVKTYEDVYRLRINCEKAMTEDNPERSAERSCVAYMLGNGDLCQCEVTGVTKEGG